MLVSGTVNALKWERRSYAVGPYVLFFIGKLNCIVDSFDTFSLYKGSVPLFPGAYVPRYICAPVGLPVFPGSDVPRLLYFNSGH